MIGADLLNLLYGNPMSQIAQATNPPVMPNPNPNAPPRPQAPTMSPAPASIGGPPGHFETLPDQAGSPHWVPGPAKGPMAPGPPPIGGPQMPQGGPPGGGAPNAPPGPPPGQGGLPPTAATQSPPDLASLYLQLENRNRSANEIDHGLAMMASAFAAPGTQGQIMHSADNMNQDPGAQLSNLIQLQNLQRQAANRPNIIAALTGGAGGAVDPNMAAAYGGMSNEQLQTALPDKMKAQIGLQTDAAKTKQDDMIAAQGALPDATRTLGSLSSNIDQIKGAIDADGKPVLQNILADPSKQRSANALMTAAQADKEGNYESWLHGAGQQFLQSGLTQEEINTIMQMKQASGQQYAEALNSIKGSRRTQTEIQGVSGGLSQILNINQGYDDGKGGGYLPALNKFQTQVKSALADAHGAAGALDALPDQYKWGPDGQPLVNQEYRPGGDLYGGKGGAWSTQDFNSTYNSLPSGAIYTGPDGLQHKKL